MSRGNCTAQYLRGYMQSAVRTRVLIFFFSLFSSSFSSPLFFFPVLSSFSSPFFSADPNPCADIFGFGVGGCFCAVEVCWVVGWGFVVVGCFA